MKTTVHYFRLLTLSIMLLGSTLALSACGDVGEREDLKSPCVGLEGSPCGPRRSVNDWWLS